MELHLQEKSFFGLSKLIVIIAGCAFTVSITYSQTNTFPPTGNVGINTMTPASRLHVHGNTLIDSSLVIKDSLTVFKNTRIGGKLFVTDDVKFSSDLYVKEQLYVNGNTNAFGDITIESGNLVLPSQGATSLDGEDLIGINQNGNLVNIGNIIDLIYFPPYFTLCSTPNSDHPAWQRSAHKMYLLNNNCVSDVRLGVGISPDAKFHVRTEENSTLLPLLIEKNTTSPTQPVYKLMQLDNDGVLSTREVVVNLDNWPDYVFESNYPLLPLGELAEFVEANKHLPNIPKASTVENEGLNLGEMNKLLLQKVEELTLYLIDQQEQINKQQQRIDELEIKMKQP